MYNNSYFRLLNSVILLNLFLCSLTDRAPSYDLGRYTFESCQGNNFFLHFSCVRKILYISLQRNLNIRFMDIVLCDTCEGTGKVDQWVGNEREPREGVCPKCFGHRVVYRRQFVLETSLGRRDEMIDKERRILNIIRE